MGPPLRKEATASINWVKRLMTGEMTGISGDSIGYVDLNSVATAHVRGITVPDAANRRFILVKETHTFHEIAQPIIDKYVPLGWPISQDM